MQRQLRPVDVLMELLPRSVPIAMLDAHVPLIADTQAHILAKGTADG
ncbi:MAG: hypothetical protein ABIP20_19160 [Chthoniobacteraceae bacterium]